MLRKTIRLTLLAAAGISATLGDVACTARADASNSDAAYPLRGAVRRALESERPFVARLSGSKAWSNCVDERAERSEEFVCRARQISSLKVAELDRAMRSAGPDTANHVDRLWSSATIDLSATPTAQRVDRIIADLTQVAESAQVPANLRNDLAVALLVRYAARRDVQSLLAAFDQIEAARGQDSTSSVIAFNRALILERLHLYEEAERSWIGFLANDSTSGWANEARHHVVVLRDRGRIGRFDPTRGQDSAAVGGDSQGAREYVLDRALEDWSAALRRGDGNVVRQTMSAISRIGFHTASASHDSSVAHIALDVESGGSHIADGVASFVDGARIFREGRYAEAAPKLNAAVRDLRARGAHALADWAEILVAAIGVTNAIYSTADATYAAVERRAARRGDIALRARCLWGLGLSAARQGKTARSVYWYTESGRLFEQIGERTNQGAMLSQSADVLFLLGRDDAALGAKLAALAALDSRRDAAVRAGPLVALGRQLKELGYPHASLASLHEAALSSAKSKRISDHPEALLRLAEAEFASGSPDRGRLVWTDARIAVQRIQDTVARARLSMELASVEASVVGDTAPAVALRRLDEVAAFFRRRRILFSLVRPLVQSSRLRLVVGDTSGAIRDLDEAIATIDAQVAAPSDPAGVRAIAASRREVYSAQIALRLARHDTVGAFLLAERSRGNPVASLPVMPTGQVTIAYSLLSNEAVAWILSGGALRMTRLSVAPDRLVDLTKRFESLTRLGNDSLAWSAASRELYETLIAPAERELRGAADLVVIPDGVLHRVPFAALQSADGQFLVQRVSVARESVVGTRRRVVGDARPVVTVGNPAFDARLYPDLEPLRSAAREAAAVRAAYGRVVSLDGALATKPAVLNALAAARTFHFAGHARLVDRAPQLSHLVLARTAGQLDANSISAGEVEQLSLPRLQLVILSSCGTEQARSRRDGSVNSLATAFLSAGASAVISSLWEAEDEGTSVLMERLTKRLAAGDEPAAALRHAQVEMITSGGATSAPKFWSLFTIDRR